MPQKPSIEDWERYCTICRTLDNAPHTSFNILGPAFGISRGRLSHWLKAFEEKFSACVPQGGQLIRRARSQNPQGITDKGKRIWKMGERILGQIEKEMGSLTDPVEKESLVVAASDGVSSYLFPLVLRELIPEWHQRTVRFHLEPFVSKDIVQQLWSDKIDLAIVWTGYETDFSKQPVSCQSFPESETGVNVIFHPRHPLAKLKDKSLKGEGISVRDLREHVIVYPDLYQLRELANQIGARNSYQVGTLSAVANAVRCNSGVGLFPGWPWLLNRLERQDCLQAAALRPGRRSDPSCTMSLQAIMRPGEEYSLSLPATAFLLKTRQVLKELAKQPDWVIAEPRLTLPQRFARAWSVHYITSGRSEEPFPHYQSGNLEFDKVEAGALRGLLNLHGQTSEFLVAVEGAAYGSQFLILEGVERFGLRRRSVAFFSRRVENLGFTDGMYLVGTISFDNGLRPATAPIVLANGPPLSETDFYRIVRSNAVSLLWQLDTAT